MFFCFQKQNFIFKKWKNKFWKSKQTKKVKIPVPNGLPSSIGTCENGECPADENGDAAGMAKNEDGL